MTTSEEYMKNNNIEKIKNLTEQEIQNMLGFDLAHIGINSDNEERADNDSSKIEYLFGLNKSDGGTYISNANILHFMKEKSYGKNGHIAISTNFIEYAVFYLKSKQIEFIEESARFNEKGELVSIYLDIMVGGFALRLVQKNK
ncbi:MAG: hypothetical protein FWD71_18960 [Oscillospiraceae bacterium]|nr:hypothetical protein [Oscillospiraceae bacterium]